MTGNDEESNTDNGRTQEREGIGKGDRAWREWMMIGMGLTGLLSIMSTVVAVVALASPGTQAAPARASMNAAMASSAQPAAMAPAAQKTEAVKLTIKSDDEHGKRGPDGKWHDAYLPANFTVHAGDKVTVTVDNYDEGSHTFTSSTLSAAGVMNVMIPAGSEKSPHTTRFTFTAPATAGRYLWWCAMPCDTWAMSHIGYMRGYVTVVA